MSATKGVVHIDVPEPRKALPEFLDRRRRGLHTRREGVFVGWHGLRVVVWVGA